MKQVETTPKTATAVANPGPLGLSGFALTTLVLSLANSGLFGNDKLGHPNVTALAALSLAFAYGGVAQVLAGMWEFRTGNTFGATAFTSYGAFWIAFYFLVTQGFDKGAGSYGVASFLLGWTIFTFVMMLGALRIHAAMASLFVLLFLTFLALTIAAFMTGGGGDGATINHIGGYLGILTALNAFYIACAGVLKDVTGSDMLPLFPFNK